MEVAILQISRNYAIFNSCVAISIHNLKIQLDDSYKKVWKIGLECL